MSTVPSGRMSVLMGFMATRTTSGSPVVIPPSSPPALFVARRTLPARVRPGAGSISSCTSAPVHARGAETHPDLHTLHRRNGHALRRPAGRRACGPTRRASPDPTGRPSTTTSQMPPKCVPFPLGNVDARHHRAPPRPRRGYAAGDASDATFRSARHLRRPNGIDPAEMHQVAADRDAELREKATGDRRRRRRAPLFRAPRRVRGCRARRRGRT